MKDEALRVLAPVDENPAALTSLILPLMESRPVRVTLFHSGDRKALREAEKVFRKRGLPAETIAGDGPPAREIALLAKTGRGDLIAMLTHGRRGPLRALRGSVAEEVLRKTSLPVLLARPGLSKGPWRLVLAALDGSARAERVLPLASRLAKAAGTPLYLLRAYGPGGGREARDYLEATRARLERQGVASIPVARRGASAAAILSYARDVGAHVLCLTTHGRTGLKRLFLGSVAEEVVRRSPCPVLALRA
jgi:nucleotide-binding universal stress UspA family protein